MGSKIPKHAHGTVNLDGYTSSGEELLKAVTSLYDRIVDKTLLARRLTLCANHLLDESSVPEDLPEQIDLFTDYSAKEKQKKEADTAHARERKLQETMLGIKKRFGKNAILKGLNLEDGATARERNNQIRGPQSMDRSHMMISSACRILPQPSTRGCRSQTVRPSSRPLRPCPATAPPLRKRPG